MPSSTAREASELAFLGCILKDSDILVSSYLTEAMFTKHRPIFKALVELSTKARIDADDYPTLMQAGIDAVTIAKMQDAYVTAHNWEGYQKAIFEAWAEDCVKAAFRLAQSEGYPQCLDTVERAMTAVALRQTNAKTKHVREIIHPALERVVERMKARGKIPGVSWGFEALDSCTLGAQAGQLVVVGARPSQGKSAIMAQMARKMGRDGSMVGVVTIESSETELVVRMLGSDAKIDGRDLQTGTLGQTHLADLKLSAERLLSTNILIHDQPSIRLAQLQAVIRKMARDGAKVVYLDYLQLVRVPGKERRMDEVGEVSTGLKALARELKICVVAMAQLGRDSDDRRPNMGDLQHSSQIEQDADQIWLLWHQQDNAGNFTESRIILAKVRDGMVRDIKVRFDRPTLTFYEIED